MRGESVDRPGGDSGGDVGRDFCAGLFQPMRQQLEDDVLDRALGQRFELLMRLGALAVRFGEKLNHGEDQVS